MSMNPYLAELYNTNGYQEKIAAVEGIVDAFVKQAAAEGLDLSGLSDDDIVNYAMDWGQKQAEAETDPVSEKLAEADFMGRAMAHAYADELSKIAASSTEFVAGAGSRKSQKLLPENATSDARMKAQKVIDTLKRHKKIIGVGAGGLALGAGAGLAASHLAGRKKESSVADYFAQAMGK